MHLEEFYQIAELPPVEAALKIGTFMKQNVDGDVPMDQRPPASLVRKICLDIQHALDGEYSNGESVEELGLGGVLFLLLSFWPGDYTFAYDFQGSRVEKIDIARAQLLSFLSRVHKVEGLVPEEVKKDVDTFVEQDYADQGPEKPLVKAARTRETVILRVKLERKLQDEESRLIGVLKEMVMKGIESGPDGDRDDVSRERWITTLRLAIIEALSQISALDNERVLAAYGEARQRESGLTAEQLNARDRAEAEAEARARGPIKVQVIKSRDEMAREMFGRQPTAEGVDGVYVPKDCAELMRTGQMTVEGYHDVARTWDGQPIQPEWRAARRIRGNIHQEQADAREQRRVEQETEAEAQAREELEEEERQQAIRDDEEHDFRPRGWGNRMNMG